MSRGQLAILSGIVSLALVGAGQAQTINLSLNLHHTNLAEPSLGGSWTLVAKTNGVNGIAGISALLLNVNVGGVVYQPGINAYNFGSPGTFGGAVNLVYFQDLSAPADIVTNVGRGAGTPGNLPIDESNDPAWHNAAKIMTGTFGAIRPAFTSVGPQSTDGNVFGSASAPYSVIDATVTTVVRDILVGDYNRDGDVDAADYVVWRKTSGAMGLGHPADGNGNNSVDAVDYNLWKRGFGLIGGDGPGAGSGSATMAAVPEPASAISVVLVLAIGLLFNRQTRSCSAIVRLTPSALLLVAALSIPHRAYAAPRTWIGGNNDWVDGVGNNANWSPVADEPDPDDEAIFNMANAVSMGSNNAIVALTMSGNADLFSAGFDLDVNGLVQLSDANTNLFIGTATSLLTADGITINNGANLESDGGTIQINEESGNGLLDINAGGELVGHGTVSMTDAVAANTTLIINDGIINARRSPAFILGPPQVGTLSINATDVDTRIDLDGTGGELGEVIVGRNQTLDINIQLTDIFNSSMSMAQNSLLDVSTAWILGANGAIDINNGATGGIGGAPAGVATIAGPNFSQNSGTITVLDADGTLQFDAPFSGNGGSIVNNGLIVFNSSTTIAALVGFTMPTTSSSITVAANRTVNINANNFNMDGSNSLTNVITVEAGGTLNINTTDYDPDSATNAFDGTITINSGSISVSTSDAEFVMDGTLNMIKSGAPVVEWEGLDQLDIGNDAGSLDANLNIGGNGNTLFHSQVDFNADADVNIAPGCGLILNLTTNFNTVNGVNNAEFTGSGALRFNGQVNVNEAVTFNMTGGTVDFDGLDSVSGDTVNVDAPVTVNAATMESFGKINTAGANTLDINNSAGTGVLTVNLDNANNEWTLNAQGVMNLVNDNTDATLLAGNDVNINGTVNVTGDVRSTARIDFGSTATVTIITAGEPLRLGGGNAGPDVNTINGGTIGGGGLLGADNDKALHGFGNIGADIDFDGTASLRAAGGTLTIGGDIVDVNILGTANNTGILNIVNAWETDGGAGGSIGAVVLNGGVLQGGVITNDNATGLQGHGTITARVINTSKIVATNGGTLLVQTSGNDNDWDGAANTGDLEALSGDLEMVDTTMPVPPVRQFGGSVRAINDNRVFANGFALDFNPGSSLTLEDEATYRASSSTDIGGTVTIGAGADATIQVANNFFLTFETGSATTLNGDVSLINNNINIEQGATFSGSGALKIPDGSHMVADNQADIGVLLDMQGAFRPGNFNGIGRVELLDMQMSDTSELFVELIGTGLNQFDRLVASGDVIVDGYLNIDIDEISPGVPFVPALGQTFNIITGNSVTGEFDFADVSGMPAGLAFHIEYLANAVQLQVVTKPIFSADFDEDGDVDKTDLAIWDGAYDLNQLGDADGDNDSDGNDMLIWQRQFGSAPGAGSGAMAESNVPEPALLPLLLIAISSLAAAHRDRVALP